MCYKKTYILLTDAPERRVDDDALRHRGTSDNSERVERTQRFRSSRLERHPLYSQARHENGVPPKNVSLGEALLKREALDDPKTSSPPALQIRNGQGSLLSGGPPRAHNPLNGQGLGFRPSARCVTWCAARDPE